VSKLSLHVRQNIFHYRTDTLFNQKHAVRLKKSTGLQCLLCQKADSALHILAACQHRIISGIITERHNVACRLIMKAISKGSLADCLAHLDAGIYNRLAPKKLRIPEHANYRTIPRTTPSWLFDAHLFARDSLSLFRKFLPLAALMPFPSLPYLDEKSKLPTTPSLHQVSRPTQPSRAHELNSSVSASLLLRGKYTTSSIVKIHSLDTSCMPLENSTFFASA